LSSCIDLSSLAFASLHTIHKGFAMTTRSAQWIKGLAVAAFSLTAPMSIAQELPYTEGSVWSVSMIRVKPGMSDVYFRDVLPQRKQIFDEAKKQGLVLSSKTLSGISNGRDDFDVMFLVEFKNWAAFDGMEAKFRAIESKIVGAEDKQLQVMTKRLDVREILGEKVMQELITK
jgi:hypothetical protein